RRAICLCYYRGRKEEYPLGEDRQAKGRACRAYRDVLTARLQPGVLFLMNFLVTTIVEIAGRLSLQIGAFHLERTRGEHGVAPARWVFGPFVWPRAGRAARCHAC